VKSKNCRYCGRDFEWRKKWESSWDEVQFCSQTCRSKFSPQRCEQLEADILALLKQRDPSSSICPSEVLSPDNKKNKDKMEEVRCAARRLVHKGLIQITQKQRVVDPSNFKGPIRLRLKR
jgi:hypothetical protein